MRVLKAWFRADAAHSARWRSDAREDFRFAAGRQYNAEDEAKLIDERRPNIVFNRTLPVLKIVAGIEINSRHEITYLPRGTEDTAVNEVLTAGSRWMADQCDAEDEESEAFQVATVCGMGWTESRLDYDVNIRGDYVEEAIDPREMFWDRRARKKNLIDAQRLWRVRRMPIEDARDLLPDVTDDLDLDAAWASGFEVDGEEAKPDEDKDRREEGEAAHEHPRDVTIVEVQWVERERRWIIAGDAGLIDLSDAEYATLKSRADLVGLGLNAVARKAKVYKRAFLGRTLLGKVEAAPCGDRFSWTCVTGELDRDAGTWFGLVRLMRDPQTWANKWLSQSLHIINANAKGGIFAEADAFEDVAEAEETYAQADAITLVKPGALSGPGPKIRDKPQVQFPAGFIQLIQFAVSAIPDVTGINLELMGLRDVNQPGVLEAHRKQAAMTILATLFDSLRRFRKLVGRARLHLMQNFLADGRILRVTGPDGVKAMPLLAAAVQGEYDVVVRDAPTSPNQKEVTWGIIVSMLPAFRDMLTPEVAVKLLRYSPLPSEIVDELGRMVQARGQPDPQAMQREARNAALAEAAAVAKVERDKAAALRDASVANKNLVDAAQGEAGLKTLLASLQLNGVPPVSAHAAGLPAGTAVN
jgi:hypothetical protein